MSIRLKKNDLLFCLLYCMTAIACSMFLKTEYRKTYFFYIGIMTLSLILLLLDESCVQKDNNHFLLWIGLTIAGAIMAFRNHTGLDDANYRVVFSEAGRLNLFEYLFSKNGYFSSGLEKGYLLLNYLIYHLTYGNFDVAQIITSYLPFIIWGKAIIRYRTWGSTTIMLFLIWTHYYFLIMEAALVRIFIAISIVFYSLSYLPERNWKKYFLFILCAAFFHRSALFMLILLVYLVDRGWLVKNWMFSVILLIITVPVAFLMIGRYIVPVLGARYSLYVLGSFSVSIDNFDMLPILLLSILFIPDIPKESRSIYIIGLVLCVLSVIFSVFNSLIPFGRLSFFANLGVLVVFSQIKKVKTDQFFKAFIPYVLLVYALVYMTYTGFTIKNHIPQIFPYVTLWGWVI